jgi:hypothetical protein
VVVKSGLGDVGTAPRRELQVVLRDALLGQTERTLIEASHHAEFLGGAERQEECFLQEVPYPLKGGSLPCASPLYPEPYLV